MKQIPLSQGKFAIVDDEDYEWLSQSNWCYSSYGYAKRNLQLGINKRTTIYMHRLICPPQDVMQVDHINGDKLDNRRSNLRIVTIQQNSFNQRSKIGSSRFKGVTLDKKTDKWIARIKCSDIKNLGYFDSEIEAAKAYNSAATRLFGEYAKLNAI